MRLAHRSPLASVDDSRRCMGLAPVPYSIHVRSRRPRSGGAATGISSLLTP